jgi:DNA-3-methyladenine glycosylase II
MRAARAPRSPDVGGTIIETETDVARGVKALRRACVHLRRAHDVAGDPPLRRSAPGLPGLARIVVGQQLSVASAEAIWRRTVLAVDPFTPAALLAAGEASLRAAGLSQPKVRTLKVLALALAEGLDLAQLSERPDAEVREVLTTLPGIGPWSADIYLLFCLGRRDAWAPGDLALQVATQHALELDRRPGPAELAAIAERWRPWRAVAARLLWGYYAATRRRGPVQPL